VSRGEGAYLHDLRGQKYMDLNVGARRRRCSALNFVLWRRAGQTHFLRSRSPEPCLRNLSNGRAGHRFRLSPRDYVL